ncbi:hypothetical protein H1R20_g10420, partial [Candolleomyces eurysporus]
MKSNEMGPPTIGDLADFPILGINDDLECTIRIRQVRDDDDSGPFLPVHDYYLELRLCIMPQSGFVVDSGESPWIGLAHYVGLETDDAAPEWVVRAGKDNCLAGIFYQPRARMLERVQSILEAKPTLNIVDGPKIRLWCHKATPMYNTKAKRIMRGLEL